MERSTALTNRPGLLQANRGRNAMEKNSVTVIVSTASIGHRKTYRESTTQFLSAWVSGLLYILVHHAGLWIIAIGQLQAICHSRRWMEKKGTQCNDMKSQLDLVLSSFTKSLLRTRMLTHYGLYVGFPKQLSSSISLSLHSTTARILYCVLYTVKRHTELPASSIRNEIRQNSQQPFIRFLYEAS